MLRSPVGMRCACDWAAPAKATAGIEQLPTDLQPLDVRCFLLHQSIEVCDLMLLPVGAELLLLQPGRAVCRSNCW